MGHFLPVFIMGGWSLAACLMFRYLAIAMKSVLHLRIDHGGGLHVALGTLHSYLQPRKHMLSQQYRHQHFNSARTLSTHTHAHNPTNTYWYSQPVLTTLHPTLLPTNTLSLSHSPPTPHQPVPLGTYNRSSSPFFTQPSYPPARQAHCTHTHTHAPQPTPISTYS